jgi:hypothetical protein
VHHPVQEQPVGVDQQMALAAADCLAGVVADRLASFVILADGESSTATVG